MSVVLVSVALMVVFVASTSVCYAEKAEIVLNRPGCDYFIALGNSGYYLLEWYGGYDPSEGDVIVGPISSYGLHDVYYPEFDNDGNVCVENFWLQKNQALEEYIDHCQ